MRPKFGWLSTDTIRETFKRTTQYVRLPGSEILKKRYKSPFPALNVYRREEPVAMDTVFSEVPAIDDGSTCAQLYVGTKSTVSDVYGMKSEKQLVNTLEDNIRERGAMKQLISDSAQSEIGKRILAILRTLCIPSWQSEPYQQHQNPCERRYQDIKRMTNTLLDRTGSLPSTWLLAMAYVCFLLNHTYNGSIRSIPITVATGSTPDISPLLAFTWWEPVYYKVDDSKFPTDSREKRGRFVGIAENVGHSMTFKVLTDDTQRVICRSGIRSALDSSSSNLRLDPIDGESLRNFVKFREDSIRENQSPPMDNIVDQDRSSASSAAPSEKPIVRPIIDPADLVGRSFLKDQDDGERHRFQIIRMMDEHLDKIDQHPERIKYLCRINESDREELIAYNEILSFIESQAQNDVIWNFRRIVGHEGPLARNHPDYNGSNFNVKIEWENGEITSEPLNVIASDDPVTCAIYARENQLLDVPGWKRFKSIAKREKKYLRMVNQAKLRSYNTAKRYKYGFQVPRNYEDAVRIDRTMGNTKWQDAVKLELDQVNSYNVFIDHGSKPPADYRKIRVHLVFDVKHDGRHKARLVADGHLTEVPLESVYSGVVSLRGIRILVFLAELNQLETWATDIGNAYLEAKTSEKLYIVAGAEFGDLQGHVLVIDKALYGLRTSGKRWHERLSDCLRDLGFQPCIAEPDIWLRPGQDCYEYIGVYVDDLAIVAKDPQEIIDKLTDTHKFKLKGTGPMSFHLGCDYKRDNNGVLCISPTKYIGKIVDGYKQMFGCSPPANISSPLEKGDHPEMDTSELLDAEGIERYQSLIGTLQWAVSLGRMDIATAVMSMSSFRAAPRQGHLERVKRIVGYLYKMRHGAIRVRTNEPDLSSYGTPHHDWMGTVYGDCEEDIPTDAPPPKGKFVTTIHYVDANLMHDMISGKSVTGCVHFLNQTPVDAYSKKQATVETATYGSEFVAARTCTEQIIELRTLLRYLGVPIREQSYMFGDNQAVVKSSTLPEAKLHKRHTLLSFHRVRLAIAARIVHFIHIDGRINPADILSKHWGYRQVWENLQPLLFWGGDTMDTIDGRKKYGDLAGGEFLKDIDKTMEEDEDEEKIEENINRETGKLEAVPSGSKGRGVSRFTKGLGGVKDSSDSADVNPFLTVGAVSETACLSCVSTMNEPAGDWHDCEPPASPMPMDGGE